MSNYIEVSNIYNAGWIMTQGIDPIAVQQNEGTDRLTYVFEDTEELRTAKRKYHYGKITMFNECDTKRTKHGYFPVFSVRLAGFLMLCGLPCHHLAAHEFKANKQVYYFISSEKLSAAFSAYRYYICYHADEEFAIKNVENSLALACACAV